MPCITFSDTRDMENVTITLLVFRFMFNIVLYVFQNNINKVQENMFYSYKGKVFFKE